VALQEGGLFRSSDKLMDRGWHITSSFMVTMTEM
jgi:hypothetical protein